MPAGIDVDYPTRLPSASDISNFDGTSTAPHWLARLRWAFKSLNGTMGDPNAIVQAVDMGLTGQAATLLDSTEAHQDIVAQPTWGRLVWETQNSWRPH